MCMHMSDCTNTCLHVYMYEYMYVAVHVHVHAFVLQCIQVFTCAKCLALGSLSLATARPSGSARQSPSSWLHQRNDHNGDFFLKPTANEITRSLPWEQRSRRSLCCGTWQSLILPSHFCPNRDRFEQFDFKKWSSGNGNRCVPLSLAYWKTLY